MLQFEILNLVIHFENPDFTNLVNKCKFTVRLFFIEVKIFIDKIVT